MNTLLNPNWLDEKLVNFIDGQRTNKRRTYKGWKHFLKLKHFELNSFFKSIYLFIFGCIDLS